MELDINEKGKKIVSYSGEKIPMVRKDDYIVDDGTEYKVKKVLTDISKNKVTVEVEKSMEGQYLKG